MLVIDDLEAEELAAVLAIVYENATALHAHAAQVEEAGPVQRADLGNAAVGRAFSPSVHRRRVAGHHAAGSQDQGEVRSVLSHSTAAI